MGGSLYSLSSALHLSKSTFSESDAKNGGALTLASGNNTIQSCYFFNVNVTELGGAIFVPVTAPYYAYKNEDAPTSLLVSNSRFEQCMGAAGGGMYVDVGVPLEVRACNFTHCKADDSGGGIYASALAASAIQDTIFQGCSAGFSGGAVAIVDGIVSVDTCTFVDCSGSVVVETATCLQVTMTDLFGDGWTGSKLYVMSFQDFVTLKRAGLDLTTTLSWGDESTDDFNFYGAHDDPGNFFGDTGDVYSYDYSYSFDATSTTIGTTTVGTTTTATEVATSSSVSFDETLITDDYTFEGNSTYEPHITTLLSGYTQTDNICFDKRDGDEYVVVTTADTCKSRELLLV